MRFLEESGACDCHSHVFGPFHRFSLSSKRTFDPPESPIEQLAPVWKSLGIDRAVLVQGSAHGQDPSAMLAAIALSPETRRGVALLSHEISEKELAKLHDGGVRAVRFNWIHHLLSNDSRTERQRLSDAARLLKKIAVLAWHAEVHIDVADLHLVEELDAPDGMPIVVDHMARIDLSAPDAGRQVERLLDLLSDNRFWVKLSGADRLTSELDDMKQAVSPMRDIASAAPDRCVWGLDWPHVNLQRKRPDADLTALLSEAARDDTTLKQVLIHNPGKLYGFPSRTAG
jgi:predicted TIM-barrel fold metal-dependent hydrolase